MLITEKEFNKMNVEISEYQKKQVEGEKALAKQLEEFFPPEMFYKISIQDEKAYFEHCEVALKVDGMTFPVKYWPYEKRYHFFCEEINKLPNINSWIKTQVMNTHEKPNKVGVLTKRKIQDWMDYWKKVYQDLKEISDKNKSEIEAFIETLKDQPVTWSKDKKQGFMTKNGIHYEFTIFETHVSQDIRIELFVKNTLENFLKLSDNKYKQENARP